jgi:hypothetical protein
LLPKFALWSNDRLREAATVERQAVRPRIATVHEGRNVGDGVRRIA